MSNKFNIRNNHFSLCISHLALNILLKSIACFSKLQKFHSSEGYVVKHKLLIYRSEKAIKKNIYGIQYDNTET